MTRADPSSLVDELVISVHQAVPGRHGARLRPIIEGWDVPMPGIVIELAEFVLAGRLTVDIAQARFPFLPAHDVIAAVDWLDARDVSADLRTVLLARGDTAASRWGARPEAVADAFGGAGAALHAASEPLAESFRGLPLPEPPAHRLHHLLTGLRYERLSVHVSACCDAGIAFDEAPQLTTAWRGEQLAGHPLRSLVERGLIDEAGSVTAAGRSLRDDIERRTELASEPMWAAVADRASWTARLEHLASG